MNVKSANIDIQTAIIFLPHVFIVILCGNKHGVVVEVKPMYWLDTLAQCTTYGLGQAKHDLHKQNLFMKVYINDWLYIVQVINMK